MFLSKFEKCGEIQKAGKTLRLLMGDPDEPVECFCFVEDMEKLLSDAFQYVRIYQGESAQ